MDDRNAVVGGPYTQRSIRARLEAFFLDNLGKVATREQLLEVATDPETGVEPENWHQRLSELRTDRGYTILSWRNRGDLKISEYMMPNAERRSTASKRMRPTAATWRHVLEQSNSQCAWSEGAVNCELREGDIDPVGGGTVRLTPDHKNPHSIHGDVDRRDPDKWQPLCGRHQVMKRNYWDDETGLAERDSDSAIRIRDPETRSLRLSQAVLCRRRLRLPRRKKERGRPMERRYPPRIDAPPEEIARVVLSVRRSARFGAEPKQTEYRCQDCDRRVDYPETLYEDGRCKDCVSEAEVGV